MSSDSVEKMIFLSFFSDGYFSAHVDNYVIEIGFKFPRMDIRGKYDVNGNVLLFPVRSKGDFWAIFRKLFFNRTKTQTFGRR